MSALSEKLSGLDWPRITDELLTKGFAQVKQVLNEQQCEELRSNYSNKLGYRKTVSMQRYRFGLGEYKYFDYPLPETVQQLRENIYPHLVPIANAWMNALNLKVDYPSKHSEFRTTCKEQSQDLATPLILKYETGGFNTLHQDLYGEIYFPIQLVINLTQPGFDYEGGELVLTQQIPRAQSQARVLQPNRGDMILFSTNFRPEKGSRGYYRVTMKHGVSEVTSGNRYTLGIIFHDASQ